ncbi:MAG TPA: site-2 protease family protein [Gammaproteobacteria bacterium]
MDDLNVMQRIAVCALPVLFAITVHEVAHGWIALRLGDKTALMLGRLTLNPVRHIDPVGTILLPGLMLAIGTGFIFGWAKPVPVTWENLRHPKRDMALVAVAGPLANLLMALMWAFIMKLGYTLVAPSAAWAAQPMVYMGEAGIFINIVLMVLNLLPIPPLDGSRVIASILPDRIAWKFNRIENYGFLILLLLLATGVLERIMAPPVFGLAAYLYRLFGL